MSINSGQIFNVSEPTGAEQTKFETTAAEAEREAPNRTVSKEVEQNAEQAQDVAKQAALAAHSLGPEMTGETSAIDTLQFQAQQTTNAAAAEGKASVESAKATGASYLGQAQVIAGDALASAQSYITGHGQQSTNNNQGSGVPSQLQAGASTALSTAKEYLSAAQSAAQPHIETARSHIDSAAAAAQPHIERAKETVHSYIEGGRISSGDHVKE